MAKDKPKLHAVDTPSPETISIAKPSAFSLEKFKSKRGPAVAGVDTLQGPLPHHSISQARDFVRLHDDETSYWSDELCFVNVPIKGMKRDTLNLIDEELALRFLPSGKIQRFRLVLATKPFDVFFLCHVPSRNLDNSWNVASILACEQAKAQWVQVTSRKEENAETYKVDYARDSEAFPKPKWPTQSLSELIATTFVGRMIDRENDPGLLRLVGAKQSLS
jgi:hypothetical protein